MTESKQSIIFNATDAKENILFIQLLKENPIFNMSLGSKELFHSNFWAWLLSKKTVNYGLRRLLSNIPEEITFDYSDETQDDVTGNFIYREKDHLDLVIRFKENGGYKNIVIENKIKAVPSKTQLEQYTKQINKNREYTCSGFKKSPRATTECFLVAPEALLPSSQLAVGWSHVTYESLIKVIRSSITSNDDEEKTDFQQNIVTSYCDFTEQLCSMASKIKSHLESETAIALPSEVVTKQLSDIRIHDLYQKTWLSILNTRLNINQADYEIGYTHGRGLITWRCKFLDGALIHGAEMTSNNCESSIGVQIQGIRFCVYVLCDKKCVMSQPNDTSIKYEIANWMANCFPDENKRNEYFNNNNEPSPTCANGRAKYSNCASYNCGGRDNSLVFIYKYCEFKTDITINKLKELINNTLNRINDSFDSLSTTLNMSVLM